MIYNYRILFRNYLTKRKKEVPMISSNTNQQIKSIIKLKKSAKERRKEKLFLVEGIRMYREIPEDSLVKAYVTPQFYEENKQYMLEDKMELVSETIMKEISDTVTPQGVVAIVKQPSYSFGDILKEGEGTYLVLENLQDPGNLGTILRTGEGAGIAGVIMSHDTVDIYNTKVIRATMGSIFRVPFCYVENLEEAVLRLQQENIMVCAAHLQGDNLYDVTLASKVAFLIGNEGNGLSDHITSLATKKIKIPMCGKVESLNASIAATILMYESLRQRS